MSLILEKIYSAKKWSIELRRLYQTGELLKDLPEVAKLYGIPQTEKWHPEICTGWHMELCLDALQAQNPDASFTEFICVLFHDLGKAVTPENNYPAHHQHERLGIPLVVAACQRFGLSAEIQKNAVYVCDRHLQIHNFKELTTKKMLEIAKDVIYGGIDENVVVAACYSDAAGRLGKELSYGGYTQGQLFLKVVQYVREHPNTFDQAQQTIEWADVHKLQLNGIEKLKSAFTFISV